MAQTPQEKKDKAADRHYAAQYGVSLEFVKALEIEQSNEKGIPCCAICGRERKSRRLSLDHNHRSGKVRKLLCHTCNRKILGCIEKFRVCPSWIVKYLEATDPENPLLHGEGWQVDIGRPPRKKRKK